MAATDKPDIESYVAQRLQGQIDYFDRAAGREQRLGRIWQYCQIVAAAVTPLLIGLAEIFEEAAADWFRAASLVTAAVAAIATSVLAARRHWENGVLFRAREQALMRERELWRQGAGRYGPAEGASSDPDRLLIETVEDLIDEDISGWTARMREASKRSDGG